MPSGPRFFWEDRLLRRWLLPVLGGILLLSCAGVVASRTTSLADPSVSGPALYYFSSLSQGFAALVGILLTVSMVAVQVVAGEYGGNRASKQLLSNRTALSCLALYSTVILGSLYALGSRPSNCGFLAGLMFVCASLALVLTAVVVRNWVAGMSPEAFLRQLTTELLLGDPGTEEAIRGTLSHLASKAWYPWLTAFRAYVDATIAGIQRLPVGGARVDAATRMLRPYRRCRFPEAGEHEVAATSAILRGVDYFVETRDPSTAWVFLSTSDRRMRGLVPALLGRELGEAWLRSDLQTQAARHERMKVAAKLTLLYVYLNLRVLREVVNQLRNRSRWVAQALAGIVMLDIPRDEVFCADVARFTGVRQNEVRELVQVYRVERRLLQQSPVGTAAEMFGVFLNRS